MKSKKKQILALILFVAIMMLSMRNDTPFYSISFGKMRFHLPLELEYVEYFHFGLMEKFIKFQTEEDLEKWQEFIEQMNHTEFERGRCLIASNYCGGRIILKFKEIEEPFDITCGESDISVGNFMWIPSEMPQMPFSEEEFSAIVESMK